MAALSQRRAPLLAWSGLLALVLATPVYIHAVLLEGSEQPHDGWDWSGLGLILMGVLSPIWIVPSLVLAIVTSTRSEEADRSRLAWTATGFSFLVGIIGLVVAFKEFRPVIGTYSDQARLEVVAAAIVAGLPLVVLLLSRRGVRRRAAPVGHPDPGPFLTTIRRGWYALPWSAWAAAACLAIGAYLYMAAYSGELAGRPDALTSFDALNLVYLFVLVPFWYGPVLAVAVAATVVRDADHRRRLATFCTRWTFWLAVVAAAVMVIGMDPHLGTYWGPAPLVLVAALTVCCIPRVAQIAARNRQSARPRSIA